MERRREIEKEESKIQTRVLKKWAIRLGARTNFRLLDTRLPILQKEGSVGNVRHLGSPIKELTESKFADDRTPERKKDRNSAFKGGPESGAGQLVCPWRTSRTGRIGGAIPGAVGGRLSLKTNCWEEEGKGIPELSRGAPVISTAQSQPWRKEGGGSGPTTPAGTASS